MKTISFIFLCSFHFQFQPPQNFLKDKDRGSLRREAKETNCKKMDEAMAATTRYWCHECSQMVHPVMEVEPKCPLCNGGFIEEMEVIQGQGAPPPPSTDTTTTTSSDLSLWAPILLGMFNDGLRRRQRLIREDDTEQQESELVTLFRRRQRASAILEVLNDLQDRLRMESQPTDIRDRERRREQQMILINPFNQAFNTSTTSSNIGTSLGDYFIGPGLEQLLQHLAASDPSRHGTPPAQKEAVEAMATVRIEEKISCCVCLEDFEVGEEAREMPCKHRFHGECILTWLQAHSSCPVCRYQMPVEGLKNTNGDREEGSGSGGDGRRSWMMVPWPFNGLFSLSSGSETGNGSSSTHSEGN